jgi:purine nucleosidase
LRRVLIDCDPGIDDALAILLAISTRKALSVEAITTVSGNVDVDQCTRNVLAILELCNLENPPVVGVGCRLPLNGDPLRAGGVHGEYGLGNYPVSSQTLLSQVVNGIELIPALCLSKRIDTIISIGPLTNIARVLIENPRVTDCLSEIVIMGGAVFVPGNTDGAEFNIASDPEAASIVFSSNIVKKILVSLDITQKVLLTAGHLQRFREYKKNRLSDFIVNIARYSINRHRRGMSLQGCYLHDPLAVGVCIEAGLVRTEPLCIDVDTVTRKGRTFVADGPPNVLFCSEVDQESFMDLFLDAMASLVSRCG